MNDPVRHLMKIADPLCVLAGYNHPFFVHNINIVFCGLPRFFNKFFRQKIIQQTDSSILSVSIHFKKSDTRPAKKVRGNAPKFNRIHLYFMITFRKYLVQS